jgi:ribonuclease HII
MRSAVTTPARARRRLPARPGLGHERTLWSAGHRVVAGVDEVGRGAWAGPLTVGVAVLCEPPRRLLRGLRESKQLTEDAREAMFERVADWCAGWAVGHAGPEECDRLGMTAALRLATRRAFAQLSPDLEPEAVVLDGNFDYVSPPAAPRLFELDGEQPAAGSGFAGPAFDGSGFGGSGFAGPAFDGSGCTGTRPEGAPDVIGTAVEGTGGCGAPSGRYPTVTTVIGGDARCASVAAASVLAKVTRDRIMRANAPFYPPFEFERNKGYPSPTHKRALCGYGLSAVHRRSWAFVGNLPWERTSWWPGRRVLDEDLELETDRCAGGR